MSTTRKAITIINVDSAITLLKPFSSEYHDHLFVIHEDAYGELFGILTSIKDIRDKLSITDEEMENIVNNIT